MFGEPRLVSAPWSAEIDSSGRGWGNASWSTHLFVMDKQRIAGLGLEPVLTTSELAEYLAVHVQAFYELRTDGRGPAGIHVVRSDSG